jgi:hypothetical protein
MQKTLPLLSFPARETSSRLSSGVRKHHDDYRIGDPSVIQAAGFFL